MGRKLRKVERWLIQQHEAAVSNQDYTCEMALRDTLRKVREVQNG